TSGGQASPYCVKSSFCCLKKQVDYQRGLEDAGYASAAELAGEMCTAGERGRRELTPYAQPRPCAPGDGAVRWLGKLLRRFRSASQVHTSRWSSCRSLRRRRRRLRGG